MRIQETGKVLKESRIARNNVAHEQHDNLLSRAWKALTSKFRR